MEAALSTFDRTLRQRAELQTVALEDIAHRLQALRALADTHEPDTVKRHETLRDLARVFESLANNAQAFMPGIGRSIELQQAEATAVLAYKKRLIDYLVRFIGDLAARSGGIAQHITHAGAGAAHRLATLSYLVAQRQARNSAPGAQDLSASTPWAEAPPLRIHPRDHRLSELDTLDSHVFARFLNLLDEALTA